MRCSVVESLGVDTVIMVPDRFLAANVARQTRVKIIAWHGACEVHERFTAEELLRYREDDPVDHSWWRIPNARPKWSMSAISPARPPR